MSYSILIPIYNEVSFLPKLVESLNVFAKNHEIIIIDDGSNDGSKEILKKIRNMNVIYNDKNCGKGYSIQRGIKLAKNDSILLMDGDLEVNTNDIPLLIKEFETLENSKKKAVVGIRWNNIWDLDLSKMMMGNFIINKFFNTIFNTRFRDILCCYKILSKKNFIELDLYSYGFSIETEIMAKLVLSNYDVKEVYVEYEPRTISQGKKLKVINGINIFLMIIKQKLLKVFNLI
ncbi:MAG: hypothetical protein CMB55_08765 [Euryarchaeota archaeon]|nr:hypothetical protein [Euryarchaeota archaeon]